MTGKNIQETDDDTQKKISLIEEHVVVSKEIIETGKVHLHKTVAEETVSVNLPIINETYDVQRIMGNADLLESAPRAVRYEGEKIIVTVIKEVPVVVKKFQVIEEIHLTRKLTETPLSQEIVLRKEQATITKSSFNIH
jgi:stress response protein YsnF